jgi:hypothetical protein
MIQVGSTVTAMFGIQRRLATLSQAARWWVLQCSNDNESRLPYKALRAVERLQRRRPRLLYLAATAMVDQHHERNGLVLQQHACECNIITSTRWCELGPEHRWLW